MSTSIRCPLGAFRIFFVAASLAVLLVAGATSAQAARAPAKPQNQPYQRVVKSTCAGAAKQCTVKIGKVPAGQRLDIEHISCQVVVPGFEQVNRLVLVDKGRKGAPQYAFMVPTSAYATPSNYLTFDSNTLYYAFSKHRLSVLTEATVDIESLACTVTGRLVPQG